MKPMTVRQGHLCDLNTIVAMQKAMALETENISLNQEILTAGVRAVFDDPSKGSYWIAELQEAAVGMLLTLPEWSDWRNGTVMWIHSVYVMPEFRRLHVFKALYSKLKQQVETNSDLRGLRLYVEQKNHSAQKTYQALGMTRDHYYLYEWLK